MRPGNNETQNQDAAVKKAARSAKWKAFMASPWFWVIIGVVVLAIIVLIAVMWVNSGGIKQPDIIEPEKPVIDTSGNQVTIDNSRSDEEILQDVFRVSSHFEEAAKRVIPSWQTATDASKAWAIKIAKEFAEAGALKDVVLNAYADDLMTWNQNVQEINLKIIEVIGQNMDINADITTCAQVTNLVTSKEETDTTVTTVDVKKAVYVIVPVKKESTSTTRTKTAKVTWTPTCTKWQVDPAKVAAQMAAHQMAYATLYGQLQEMIDQCPQVDEYIAIAKA